jgi:outer membrane immunogenic protein
MKHLGLLAAAATILAPTIAHAATDWSGPYVGAALGFGSGDSSTAPTLGGEWTIESAGLRTDFTRIMSADLEPDGNSYGVFAGYAHQFANNIVLGAEIAYDSADYSATRTSGPIASTTFPTLTYAPGNSVDVKNVVSLRARIGYSFGATLGFVSMGWASADTEVSAEVLSNGGYSKRGVASDNLDGTSYGVGLEHSFADRWSVRGQYERQDFGDISFVTAYRPGSSFTTPPYTETFKQDLTLDTFKVGVSFNY